MAIVAAFVGAFLLGGIAGFLGYGAFLVFAEKLQLFSDLELNWLGRVDPNAINASCLVGLLSAVGAAYWAWKWGRPPGSDPQESERGAKEEQSGRARSEGMGGG